MVNKFFIIRNSVKVTVVFYLLTTFITSNCFALEKKSSENFDGIMFDQHGLTVKFGASTVEVDTNRWGSKKEEENISLLTPITKDKLLRNNKVYISFNKKNQIQGLKEVTSQFTRYFLKDAVIVVDDKNKGFLANDEVCTQLKKSFSELNKCKDVFQSLRPSSREISSSDLEVFDDIPKDAYEENLIKDLGATDPFETLNLVMNSCESLLRYAKPVESNDKSSQIIPKKESTKPL